MPEIRTCIVCGKKYTTGPSCRKDTCSPECAEFKMLAWLKYLKHNKRKLLLDAFKWYVKHEKYIDEEMRERWK